MYVFPTITSKSVDITQIEYEIEVFGLTKIALFKTFFLIV